MSSFQNKDSKWSLANFNQILELSSISDKNQRLLKINKLSDETLICLVELVFNILMGSIKLPRGSIRKLTPESRNLRYIAKLRNIDDARVFLIQTGGSPVAILFPILVSTASAILEHVLR